MKKIVITEFMDEKAVESLKSGFKVVYNPALVDDQTELLSQLEDADGLIVRNRTQVKGELLNIAKKLSVVGRLGVGMDNIDLEACKQKNIHVFPAIGANDEAVAEYVIAAILILFRKAYQSFQSMIDGEWPRTQLMGNEISGKCLGLIGFGGIARETATRARAMGMDVVAYDPYLSDDHPAWENVKNVSFEALIDVSDVISLHVPLTPETKHLINQQVLAKMRKGAFVINAARGGVLDEESLISGLESGHIGGAALDVYELEPLSPEQGKRLAHLKNLILTPHIAGVTVESNRRVSSVTAENVRQALGG